MKTIHGNYFDIIHEFPWGFHLSLTTTNQA